MTGQIAGAELLAAQTETYSALNALFSAEFHELDDERIAAILFCLERDRTLVQHDFVPQRNWMPDETECFSENGKGNFLRQIV